MIPKDGLDLNYLKAALRRRFWYLVVPFFFLAMATIVYCIKAPKIYMSSALILIQPQEVPMEYVQPTVTTNIQARLKSITEQVMSRSKLEEVIKKHDLYPKIRATSSMYNAVEEMRQKITIDIDQKQSSKSRGEEPAAFQISFEGKYPAQVRDVTAELAELFIDFNYRLRAEQAAGTTKFLDRQLERMKEELRQKEELVRKFKEENMGLLPEQMQNNYSILTQLQQHMDSINDSLQKTEDRKVLLQTQLNKLETLDFTSKDYRNFSRQLFAAAVSVTPDRQGRMLIPGHLRRQGNLDGEVLVLGSGTYIEFWNPDDYKGYLNRFGQTYEEVAENLFPKNRPPKND